MNFSVTEVDAILTAAIELSTSAEREEYVRRVCGENAELHQRIDELLAAHFRAGDFLEQPPTTVLHREIENIQEGPGTVIGPYKLLQQIGAGGMGVVFMAEHTRPVHRTVALKIIKPGMDTRQVIARFEAERQALALMDHPNIARVLDAGTTETGRPYFVMDLVKGVPITEYCDQQQLPIRDRLTLMTEVCHAVQHAHQKGIIHRDLKPSNVLVAEYDGKPVPKVIDFGVAKATAQKLTERTMFTEFGQLIGTFEYMSPEQARFNQLDVDTRSDIYSLGVLLYELLAGSTPLERERLRSAAFDEILRMISEEEPPKPSTRLGSSATLPAIAANRHTEPARLSREVSGELDWIVLKCLEKDRSRRYETASSIAADLVRYLKNEPVHACPPSAGYRLEKFIRRNKVGAAAIAALVVGSTVIGWQAIRATQANRIATEARDKAIAEKRRADEQTEVAVAVNGYLQDLLAAAAPNLSRQVTVVEAIEQALRKLDEGVLRDRPIVEAAVRNNVESTIKGLALSYSRAIDRLPAERAWWGDRSRLNTELTRHPILFAELVMLRPDDNHLWVCRARDLAVRDYLREAIDQYAIIIEDIPEDVDWYTYAALRLLAGDKEGYSELVARIFRWEGQEILKARAAVVSLDPPVGPDQIIRWAERAVELEQSHQSLFVLGLAQYRAGQYAKAIECFRSTSKSKNGNTSDTTSLTLIGMALTRQAQGQVDEASQVGREARQIIAANRINLRNFGTPTGPDNWIELQLLLRELAILRGAPNIPSDILNGHTRSDPWAKMASDQLQSLIWNPENVDAAGLLAVALLKLRRYEDYCRLCHTFLTEANTPREMRLASKTALLLPVRGQDFTLACDLADQSADSAESLVFEPWARLGKALAEYRREKFESAIEWSERATADPATPSCIAMARFIQASSYAHLGRLDEARDAFAKGGDTEGHSHPSQDDWRNWTPADFLRLEAQALLDPPASTESP